MDNIDLAQLIETMHKFWPTQLAIIGERYFPNITKDSKWPNIFAERLMLDSTAGLEVGKILNDNIESLLAELDDLLRKFAANTVKHGNAEHKLIYAN